MLRLAPAGTNGTIKKAAGDKLPPHGLLDDRINLQSNSAPPHTVLIPGCGGRMDTISYDVFSFIFFPLNG